MFCWKIKEDFPKAIGIAACLLMVLQSCNTRRESAALYPIDSLVAAQIVLLTEANAELQKEVYMKGDQDTISYTPKDTSEWVKELDIFRQLGAMNKPISRNSYNIEDGLPDPSSNLTVKVFTAKEDLPVEYLKVYYQGSIDRPRKIESLYSEENSLYKSSRLLTMEFQQVNNRNILTAYTIHGGQKMILGDSVVFLIRGRISVD